MSDRRRICGRLMTHLSKLDFLLNQLHVLYCREEKPIQECDILPHFKINIGGKIDYRLRVNKKAGLRPDQTFFDYNQTNIRAYYQKVTICYMMLIDKKEESL